MNITAIVIAKNEEKMLGDCLKSVKWVDEIVLVDTGSTDKTVDIAKDFGAKIVNTDNDGFSDWRNLGAENANGKWILYVDADERITPALRKEIEKKIKAMPNAYFAYAIPRRNFILGKEFKHGGQWPDYVKRLFKKSAFKGWSGQLHEEPDFEGEIGHLDSPMIHIKHETIGEMVEKTNNWSEIEARLMFKSHHPPMNVFRFFSAMFREFWLRMIRQAGFLDGTEGIIYTLYQVFSRSISYAKLWEMQIDNKPLTINH